MSEFKIGDRVHVSNGGSTFSAYEDFFSENGLEFYKQNWTKGESLPVGDYTVVATGKHRDTYYSLLYLLRSDDGRIYIAHDCCGHLTLVEREEETVIYASELMELARKEPEKYAGKRYKTVVGAIINRDGECITGVMVDGDGEMLAGGSRRVYVTSNTILEEIPPEPQHVTFEEARVAYEQGKMIRAEYPDFNHRQVKVMQQFMKDAHGAMSSNFGTELSFYIISNGTWYVEE
jgi:hypothetical protein